MSRKNDRIPTALLPDEKVTVGNEFDLSPDEWTCANLIHVCHHCGRLSRGLGGHTVHCAETHKRSDLHPTASCSALPADGQWWPEDGITVVEDLQQSLAGREGPPNAVSDVVG
jgi:hypothetical protein